MGDHSTGTAAGGAMPPATVRVWDPLVRIFHWSLVGLFVFAFVTADEWDRAHELAGYAIAGLVAFRVVWGLIGTRHARFGSFVRSPFAALKYMRDGLMRRAPRHLGHNPPGGLMILALLAAIGGIAATGWMITIDAYWGVEWVEEAHEALVYGTLVLISLHIGGVIFSSIEHGENLVLAMVTGRKRAPQPDDIA